MSCWLLSRRLCWGAQAGNIAAGFGLRSFCWMGYFAGSGGSGSPTLDGVAAGAVSASSVRLGPSVLNGVWPVGIGAGVRVASCRGTCAVFVSARVVRYDRGFVCARVRLVVCMLTCRIADV